MSLSHLSIKESAEVRWLPVFNDRIPIGGNHLATDEQVGQSIRSRLDAESDFRRNEGQKQSRITNLTGLGKGHAAA
jgi:hypothetical protein